MKILSLTGGEQNIYLKLKMLKLLTIFQRFYYRNGRYPLTNGLLVVPDFEVPQRTYTKNKP